MQPSKTQAPKFNREYCWSLDNVFRPSNEELIRMLHEIQADHNWSNHILSIMLGLSFNCSSIHMIERLICRQKRSSLRRLVWFLWSFDHNTSALFQPETIASWGRTELPLETKVVLRDELPPAEWMNLVESLERAAKSPDEYPKSERAICEEFKCSKELIRKACKIAQFTPGMDRGEEQAVTTSELIRSLPEILRPGSVWLKVDWRISNFHIALPRNLDRELVAKTRAEIAETFRKKPASFRKVLRTFKIPYEHFQVFDENNLTVRKKPRLVVETKRAEPDKTQLKK